MHEELDILKIVAENQSISQRKIAEKTGLSLGQVNFLIKKFVRKGLIKIEGQSSKSLKYNLTPKGIAEKATLTLEYIKISYWAVSSLSSKIEALCEECTHNQVEIFVYGSNDEMLELIKLVLNGNHISWSLWSTDIKVQELENQDSKYIVFYWEPIRKSELEESKIRAINILE